MRRRSTALLLVALAVLPAACGDDEGATSPTSTPASTTTAPDTVPAPAVVLRYVEMGGCQMMGPNCPTYLIYGNGAVEVYRTGEDGPAVLMGQLADGEIDAFLAAATSVDFAELAATVGPGTCNACVDGVDVTVTMELPDGEVQLDSTVVNFDPANDFFADLQTLIADAAAATGEMPLVQR